MNESSLTAGGRAVLYLHFHRRLSNQIQPPAPDEAAWSSTIEYSHKSVVRPWILHVESKTNHVYVDENVCPRRGGTSIKGTASLLRSCDDVF